MEECLMQRRDVIGSRYERAVPSSEQQHARCDARTSDLTDSTGMVSIPIIRNKPVLNKLV